MIVEDEIAFHKRVHAHWANLGDDRRKELKAKMREAEKASSDAVERFVSMGRTPELLQEMKDTEAAYHLAAKAYFGE